MLLVDRIPSAPKMECVYGTPTPEQRLNALLGTLALCIANRWSYGLKWAIVPITTEWLRYTKKEWITAFNLLRRSGWHIEPVQEPLQLWRAFRFTLK